MRLSILFAHWNRIHEGTLAIVDCFSQDELTHPVYPGGWTVGHTALHIADAEEGWFRHIAVQEIQAWPSHFTLENYPTKRTIKSLLSETHTKTMDYLHTLTIDDLDTIIETKWGNFSLAFIIWHVIEHEIHHRGELSLVLGTLGREGLDV
jgi:uncharacterized damage-inducible protein DinB